MTFNSHRSKKGKTARVEDFHPYRQYRRPAMTVDQLHDLKPMFASPSRRPKKSGAK